MTRLERILSLSLATALLGACGEPTAPAAAPAAPLFSAAAVPAEASMVPDEYIVVFRKGEQDPRGLAQRLAHEAGGTVLTAWSTGLKGFHGHMSAAAARALAHNPHVAYVEPNQITTLNSTQYSPGWALDRLDQYDNILNGEYNYFQTGAGVRAYVIDTGINTAHVEFGGRATIGYDATGGNGSDCKDHGTGVAAALGGQNYGVAKAVTIVGVRTVDCGSSTVAKLIDGINWVTGHRVLPAVATVTQTASSSQSLDDAVAASIAAGVVYVVSAGNNNTDACSSVSPARQVLALTVGGVSPNNLRYGTSNYGTCVDLYAPGDNVTTASAASTTASAMVSGTSFSAPYVAGIVALALQERPTASPREVQNAIWNAAPPYVVGNVPNPLGSSRAVAYAPHVLMNMKGPTIDFYLYPGDAGTYTWSVDAWGRPTGFTLGYTWKESWDEGATWTVVGTDATYTRYVGPDDNFRLSVDVNYGPGIGVRSSWLQVNHDGNPFSDPPGGCDNVYTMC